MEPDRLIHIAYRAVEGRDFAEPSNLLAESRLLPYSSVSWVDSHGGWIDVQVFATPVAGRDVLSVGEGRRALFRKIWNHTIRLLGVNGVFCWRIVLTKVGKLDQTELSDWERALGDCISVLESGEALVGPAVADPDMDFTSDMQGGISELLDLNFGTNISTEEGGHMDSTELQAESGVLFDSLGAIIEAPVTDGMAINNVPEFNIVDSDVPSLKATEAFNFSVNSISIVQFLPNCSLQVLPQSAKDAVELSGKNEGAFGGRVVSRPTEPEPEWTIDSLLSGVSAPPPVLPAAEANIENKPDKLSTPMKSTSLEQLVSHSSETCYGCVAGTYRNPVALKFPSSGEAGRAADVLYLERPGDLECATLPNDQLVLPLSSGWLLDVPDRQVDGLGGGMAAIQIDLVWHKGISGLDVTDTCFPAWIQSQSATFLTQTTGVAGSGLADQRMAPTQTSLSITRDLLNEYFTLRFLDFRFMDGACKVVGDVDTATSIEGLLPVHCRVVERVADVIAELRVAAS
ncbi:hypothetical protein HDU93_000192 [Gonapodya sp. JEL0774]|nr:hypothetical protein HDU93_000192 [Gonapodya sp. JEL0774]